MHSFRGQDAGLPLQASGSQQYPFYGGPAASIQTSARGQLDASFLPRQGPPSGRYPAYPHHHEGSHAPIGESGYPRLADLSPGSPVSPYPQYVHRPLVRGTSAPVERAPVGVDFPYRTYGYQGPPGPPPGLGAHPPTPPWLKVRSGFDMTKAYVLAIVVCLFAFSALVALRLEGGKPSSWTDYVPAFLSVVPILCLVAEMWLYQSAMGTHEEMILYVYQSGGLLVTALCLLAFFAFIGLRNTGAVDWGWSFVLSPMWALLTAGYMTASLRLAKFIEKRMVDIFWQMFVCLSLSSLSVLLIGIKMDGVDVLAGTHWGWILAPLLVAYLIVATSLVPLQPKDPGRGMDIVARIAILAALVIFIGKLNGWVALSWLIIFAPLWLSFVLVIAILAVDISRTAAGSKARPPTIRLRPPYVD
ncbi:unnamed protein product [Vitrella brassicaformis CCMP3155]|uniref:Uncharacterized protein n=2 Tax=Vitrella brassicaformis TaxID=1169539 RepID=A0A0G4EWR9_VITBC|nr:unnamed protein product [Vitrella brassicaformis CCMP3155]|eukprot:CEM02709.1 unnamed protein product [Vitrella brassicaformis CCMP3155]